jgi:hypothetical protein
MKTPLWVLVVIAYSHPFSDNGYLHTEKEKISGRAVAFQEFTSQEKCLFVRAMIKEESKETFAECTTK